MRILIFFLFFCSCLTLRAQNNGYQYKRYQADSMLVDFIGQKAFDKCIRLDSVTSKQNRFVFHYAFTHPSLSPEVFPIVFALDSSGQLIAGKETQGLITATDFDDAKIVTRKQALKICRSQAKSIKKNSAALICYNAPADYERYSQSRDLSAIWCGRMMWRIEGRIKFRGELADGAFYVDVLNGQVARAFAVPWD